MTCWEIWNPCLHLKIRACHLAVIFLLYCVDSTIPSRGFICDSWYFYILCRLAKVALQIPRDLLLVLVLDGDYGSAQLDCRLVVEWWECGSRYEASVQTTAGRSGGRWLTRRTALWCKARSINSHCITLPHARTPTRTTNHSALNCRPTCFIKTSSQHIKVWYVRTLWHTCCCEFGC